MTPARHLLWALPLLILAAVASDLPGTRGMHPAAVLLGFGTVLLIVGLWHYGDALMDGNVERLEREAMA